MGGRERGHHLDGLDTLCGILQLPKQFLLLLICLLNELIWILRIATDLGPVLGPAS